MEWHLLADEEVWTNWGACMIARTRIGEGEWMTVYIGLDDGRMRGLELCGGTQVELLPEDAMPVNG